MLGVTLGILKIIYHWGAWVAQSVNHSTPDFSTGDA